MTNDLEWMDESIRNRWKGLKNLIMAESVTRNLRGEKTKVEQRFYISSLEAPASEFQHMIRSHWSVENGCHWVLDTVFREDYNQTHTKRAAKNLGILRRIVLNILKIDTKLGKLPLTKKRLHVQMDLTYREHLFSLA